MPQMETVCRITLFVGVAAIALAGLAGCTPSSAEISVSLRPDSVDQFRQLPGQLGITVQNTAQIKRYVIENGSGREVGGLKKAEKSATAFIAPYGATHVLDNGPDYYVRGPYLISPDQLIIAASIELKDVNAAWSTGYLIADLKTKKILAINKSRSQGVSALAWSPDSRLLAVLREEQVRGGLRSPLEILSAFSGHPVQYMVYSLEVVDASGKRVAHSQLTEPLAGTWGEVIWGS